MFNLHQKRLAAKKMKRPINKIRTLPGCEDVRNGDLEGIDEKDLNELYHKTSKLSQSKKTTKTADPHGFGNTWTPVDVSYNPYKTSPLVNAAPQFGGRWNKDFPSGGDMHINDDSDKEKNTRGNAMDDDFDPKMRKNRVDDLTRKLKDGQYVVRLQLNEGEEPTGDRAQQVFGPDGKADGRSIYIIVDGFDNAIKKQRDVPHAKVEPMGGTGK
jgi:hypothetical protein